MSSRPDNPDVAELTRHTSTTLGGDRPELDPDPVSRGFAMLQGVTVPTDPAELLSPTIDRGAGKA
jgi:hypothetical protein